MDCDQCKEVLSDYIDGTQGVDQQAEVERHLVDCEHCRQVRDDLLWVQFTAKLPEHSPPGHVVEQVTQIRDEPWKYGTKENVIIGGILAFMVAIVVGGSTLVQSLRQYSRQLERYSQRRPATATESGGLNGYTRLDRSTDSEPHPWRHIVQSTARNESGSQRNRGCAHQ